MSQSSYIADLLFPNVTATPIDINKRYPPRVLPAGSWVSRFAPSPTGFMHIGGIYAAFIARTLCHQSGGIFFLRIEDTDKKREVPNGIAGIVESLSALDLMPDEGIVQANPTPVEQGQYGPYIQSQRVHIYETFAKDLVARGLAYPCFCSEDDLQKMRQQQEADKVKPGYYGHWAKHRNITKQEIETHLAHGASFVIRLRAPDPSHDKINIIDVIRGELQMPANDQDVVLLKSDHLPTYHFAHAVDDSLMHTNLVIRGDEWMASLPLHVQLFQLLNQPVPHFGHVAPIAKQEGSSRRKLSKRKDPEAAVTFYSEHGYPVQALLEYLLNFANSDFEEWRVAHPFAPLTEFKLRTEQMGVSNALFDLQKLNDVSRNFIARMSAAEVYECVVAWAEHYQPGLVQLLRSHKSYSVGMFGIERSGQKPRKDLAHWSQVEALYNYFFDSLFEELVLAEDDMPPLSADKLSAILNGCIQSLEHLQDKESWLEYLRQFGESIGFARNTKTYKKQPDQYEGQFGDLMMVMRIALTKRRTTPDLYELISLMGVDRVKERLQNAIRFGLAVRHS